MTGWGTGGILARMNAPCDAQPLTFWHRGQAVTAGNVPPDRPLLALLREDLGLTAAKEGCGEGDCGACTVVLAERAPDGDAAGGPPRLALRAVNACITLAHAAHGRAVFTAADIAAPDGQAHPVQAALVDCHASQCGFCTPGFAMSLWAQYEAGGGAGLDRAAAQTVLSGNLCRCTGYRPLIDAAQRMGDLPCPPGARLDAPALLAALDALPPPADGPYRRPPTLEALLRARAADPTAQLVAGTTDVGLWITKQHRRLDRVIDVTGAAEIGRIETYPHHLAIGAAVRLEAAFAALVGERPALAAWARRFAGLPVRNAGTLGGNVANGSPIGDSMPLLIALGASVVLMRWDARRRAIAHRELAVEDFYLGYRRTALAADEVLAWIKVPRPVDGEWVRVEKVSKRFDDDISAVCLAVRLRLADGRVAEARVGAGGVAAVPARARQTEAVLRGQPWSAETAEAAGRALRAEFDPLSDLRASANYRRALLANLWRRWWLDSQGSTGLRLEEAA